MFDISGRPARLSTTDMTHNNNMHSHVDYGQQEEQEEQQLEEAEQFHKGRVKAAMLPMGGPASRRVKREVEGGALAKCEFSQPPASIHHTFSYFNSKMGFFTPFLSLLNGTLKEVPN